MLRARDLGKRYGTRTVFRGVSFEVDAGRAVAIVGRNGSGKSTLLRLVAGLIRPTAGTLLWNGEKLARWMCGLSAPDAPVYRELSALENLEFVARVRGLKTSRDDLLEHLENFGLQNRDADFAGELSSGLRTRLQLAVATLHRPPILLLDEPGANLDEAGRELVKRVLTSQRERGIALVATNDEREAVLCDERIEL
jgi:heme exporter protein A